MSIILTIHCKDCNAANDWSVAEPPPRVTVEGAGYRVECVRCGHSAVYTCDQLQTTQYSPQP